MHTLPLKLCWYGCDSTGKKASNHMHDTQTEGLVLCVYQLWTGLSDLLGITIALSQLDHLDSKNIFSSYLALLKLDCNIV